MVIRKWTYEKVRKEVLERDNFKCRKCGKGQAKSQISLCDDDGYEIKGLEEVWDRMYPELEVHHINRKRFGSKDSWDFKINLTTLCRKCHKEIHNKINKLKENEPTTN